MRRPTFPAFLALLLVFVVSMPLLAAKAKVGPTVKPLPSTPTENADGKVDPVPRARPRPSLVRDTPAARHVKDLSDPQKFLNALGGVLQNIDMNVALIGGNRYMVNDCLGVKASAGEFQFRPGKPTLRLDGSGVLMQFVVDRVTLNGLMVRMRPNVGNPTKLCHFSSRFGIGGSASNVRLEIRLNPLLDISNCKVSGLSTYRATVSIGGLNLKPLQNDLDHVAKNMIEESINYFLDSQAWMDKLQTANGQALQGSCPGSAGSH